MPELSSPLMLLLQQRLLLLELVVASSAGVATANSAVQSPPARSSCGAVPLTCAPNCGSAIERACVTCSSAGGGTVTLAAGTYHANDAVGGTVALKNLHNVALVGQAGSGDYYTAAPDPTATTFLVYGLRGFLSLTNCTNMQIKGIQVDMKWQPYTYGQCTAVDPASFTIKFDPEAYPFAAPIAPWLLKVQSVMGFDPVNWRVARNAVDIYTTGDPYNATLISGKPNQLKVYGGHGIK